MNVKLTLGLLAVFLLVIMGYSLLMMLSIPSVSQAPIALSAVRFVAQETGMINSNLGRSNRAYVTGVIEANGSGNLSFDLLTFSQAPKTAIYAISDYPQSEERLQTMQVLDDQLSKYGINVIPVTFSQALQKKNALIIVSSDAMPSIALNGTINTLIDRNTIIFFGKPLEVAIDQSGAQELVGNQITDSLNLSVDSNGNLAPLQRGPLERFTGNATIFQYQTGSFILFPAPANGFLGNEIADMIVREAWQSDSSEDSFDLSINAPKTNTTFISSGLAASNKYIRLIYTSSNSSHLLDLGHVSALAGILKMPETIIPGTSVPYSFELYDNLTYPEDYSLALDFFSDGSYVDMQNAKTITMKKVSIDDGSVLPNLTSGNYVVKLTDQNDVVHALAYAHVPQLKVRLVQINGNTHVFLITIDNQPASNSRVLLAINGRDTFSVITDNSGKVGLNVLLPSGLNSFDAELNGEHAITYYQQTGSSSLLLPAAIFIIAIVFLTVLIIINGRAKKHWTITTSQKPLIKSKVIRIPEAVFLIIFKAAQNDRAPGLPLTVGDLRIAFRKYAVFKGTPVFLTDSNIHGVLAELTLKGKFCSYGGYFLPVDMLEGKPMEYWFMKRKLGDLFIIRGEDFSKSWDCEFIVKGRHLHLWPQEDPGILLKSCTSWENVLIFPDNERKNEFARKLQSYDPVYLSLSLQFQHGRLYCQTIDDFLEYGFRGK